MQRRVSLLVLLFVCSWALVALPACRRRSSHGVTQAGASPEADASARWGEFRWGEKAWTAKP